MSLDVTNVASLKDRGQLDRLIGQLYVANHKVEFKTRQLRNIRKV